MALNQVIPQVQVFQEFTQAPTAIIDPLRAFIFGPHYAVRTYAKAKSNIGLGAYDKDDDTEYAYPARGAGEIVDQDYVTLFMDNAYIRYFQDLVGADNTFDTLSPNKVKATEANFSFTSVGSYTRDSDLPKDVEVGDYCKVQNASDPGDTITSQIRSIIRETTDGFFDSATADSNNQATVSRSATLVSSPTSSFSASLDTTRYDGSVDGEVSDRYTFTITKAGAPGTAEMSVTTDSGDDDEYNVLIGYTDWPIEVGDRGLTVTFTGTGSFDAGETWTYDVVGTFTETDPPTVETSYEYTGSADTTYVLEVVKGGTSPRISMSTTTGIEAAEKNIVISAWNKIGTKGLRVWFGPDVPEVGESSSSSSRTTSSSSQSSSSSSQSSPSSSSLTSPSSNSSTSAESQSSQSSASSVPVTSSSSSSSQSTESSSSSSSSGFAGFDYRLCKGDRFYVEATAETQGRASTLVLADNLSSTLLAKSDVNVEIYKKQDIEVTEVRYNSPGVYNFETEATKVTINSGIVHYGGAGDDLNGYPVVSGTMYLGYRALEQDWVSDVQSISDSSELSTYFEDTSPENPLGFAVSLALTNSNGTAVKFIGVPTNDSNGYTQALEKVLEREDVYSFVPLTNDSTILTNVESHINSQSSPSRGRWRIMWVSETVPTTKSIVQGSPTALTGTITHYTGDVSGTYRLLEMTGGQFITNGVAAGDEVRYSYGVDAFGTATYSTGTVDSVISEQQLLLTTGPSSPVSVASKTEIHRNLSTSQQVTELVAQNTYSNRRVYNVLGGPGLDLGGYDDVEGYYLAAIYAGERSGVRPHQPLTNVGVSGIDGATFMVETLNGSQLDQLANAGYWLTAKDPTDGSFYCRKQLSTDLTDLNTSEQTLTTNVDSISYYFKSLLSPYIGRVNNVDSVRSLIETQLKSGIQYLRNTVATVNLGGQIQSATIEDIRQHATSADRLVIEMDIDPPYPLNNIDLKLII